jgi:GT2 family glycosyltransferase
MKLSIVIICWNDLKTIRGCLESIYRTTHTITFEVIVSDNGSTDGSVEFIRSHYPHVRVIENGANLRFAKANNIGIRASQGEYVLILNPDTIIHDGTLDNLAAFADEHPEAGAFGCQVLNPDGSYQESARPFPTLRGEWIAALFLRPLTYLSGWFTSDTYTGWKGDTERAVDWLSGCSLFVRRQVLDRISGFDDQFFYYYEDVDLCRRVWLAGYKILFTPQVSLTHLGGQSTKRFPIAFQLDSEITKYRYFYKYFGKRGARHNRRISLVSLFIRRSGLGLIQLLAPSASRRARFEAARVAYEWNWRVDPVRLVENGEEPKLAQEPLVRVLER